MKITYDIWSIIDIHPWRGTMLPEDFANREVQLTRDGKLDMAATKQFNALLKDRNTHSILQDLIVPKILLLSKQTNILLQDFRRVPDVFEFYKQTIEKETLNWDAEQKHAFDGQFNLYVKAFDDAKAWTIDELAALQTLHRKQLTFRELGIASIKQLFVLADDKVSISATEHARKCLKNDDMLNWIVLPGSADNVVPTEYIKIDEPEQSQNANILEQANNIVNDNSRHADMHDGPGQSFEKIAPLFSELTGKHLTTADCAAFMIVLKLVRQQVSHKLDNLVDICGYTQILADICEAKLSNNDKD